MRPTALSVAELHEAVLQCSPPAGAPAPRVSWLREGGPLSLPDGARVSPDGWLRLSRARVHDSANYSCVAENLAGRRVSEPVSLKVYGA